MSVQDLVNNLNRDLRPCPVCGDAASILSYRNGSSGRVWRAECMNASCNVLWMDFAMTPSAALHDWNEHADHPDHDAAIQVSAWRIVGFAALVLLCAATWAALYVVFA